MCVFHSPLWVLLIKSLVISQQSFIMLPYEPSHYPKFLYPDNYKQNTTTQVFSLSQNFVCLRLDLFYHDSNSSSGLRYNVTLRFFHFLHNSMTIPSISYEFVVNIPTTTIKASSSSFFIAKKNSIHTLHFRESYCRAAFTS